MLTLHLMLTLLTRLFQVGTASNRLLEDQPHCAGEKYDKAMVAACQKEVDWDEEGTEKRKFK